MANFTRTKYEADNGGIHPLRLSPSVAGKAGTEPTGDIDNPIPARMSKGSREFGLRPRGVRLARLFGASPNQFYKYKFLPLRSKTDITDSAYALGAKVNLGTAQAAEEWEIVSQIDEDYS